MSFFHVLGRNWHRRASAFASSAFFSAFSFLDFVDDGLALPWPVPHWRLGGGSYHESKLSSMPSGATFCIVTTLEFLLRWGWGRCTCPLDLVALRVPIPPRPRTNVAAMCDPWADVFGCIGRPRLITSSWMSAPMPSPVQLPTHWRCISIVSSASCTLFDAYHALSKIVESKPVVLLSFLSWCLSLLWEHEILDFR